MVTRDEAPRPGWYPDPTGRHGLLWWDGLDWTQHRRPVPTSLSIRDRELRAAEDDEAGTDAHGGDVVTASQLRARQGRVVRSAAGRDTTATVEEVRRAAREEVERAVDQATRRFQGRGAELQDLVQQWRRRLVRWARIVAVVVVVWVALSAWASATLQTSLLDWIGERIDAATATVVVDVPSSADR